MKRIVVSIYIDPDFYPPTINAIINLAGICDELVVITRNNSKENYPFPPNVKLVKTGQYKSVRESERASFVKKISSFIKFTIALHKYVFNKKSELIILYDPVPLFSFFLLKKIGSIKSKKIWYHNHDMPDINLTRKYSVGWWAAKYEHTAMQSLDFFSLPSDDRLVYYPNWKRMDNYFCIPNYPSLKVYNTPARILKDEEEIRIIFQGSIGEGHSLEELIELLQHNIDGKKLRLVLKGSVKENYKQKLNQLAESFGVTNRLSWVGLGPYSELQKLTSSCHIGIGIHKGVDEVSKTLGTASNKIYEYAASGLPVILFDIEQFRKYLGKYSWAFFCDGTMETLKVTIENILNRYAETSAAARRSFEEELNFESHFKKVIPAFQSSR